MNHDVFSCRWAHYSLTWTIYETHAKNEAENKSMADKVQHKYLKQIVTIL